MDFPDSTLNLLLCSENGEVSLGIKLKGGSPRTDLPFCTITWVDLPTRLAEISEGRGEGGGWAEFGGAELFWGWPLEKWPVPQVTAHIHTCAHTHTVPSRLCFCLVNSSVKTGTLPLGCHPWYSLPGQKSLPLQALQVALSQLQLDACPMILSSMSAFLSITWAPWEQKHCLFSLTITPQCQAELLAHWRPW